jgi:hypothetical protein
MKIKTGWLKRSLDRAAARVESRPHWMRPLEVSETRRSKNDRDRLIEKTVTDRSKGAGE